MSREVTPRDLVTLGGFVLALVIGCYAYIRHATAPPTPQGQKPSAVAHPVERSGEGRSSTASSTDLARAPFVSTKEASPAASPKRDYRFIAERNIFQPVQERPNPAAPTRPARPNAPSPPSPHGLGTPPPLPPAPPPLPATSPPPAGSTPTMPAARPANLTATSIARLGNDTYVLLENPQTRDTAWVRLGESAFGYQVVNAGDSYVEVRQGDVAYRITLGEGKQERKIMASGGAPAGSGSFRPGMPTPLGGFPPGASPTGGNQGGEGRQGDRGFRRSPSEWISRVAERWNQLPEFVRNRILERVQENWNQMTPEQQQQVRQALQNAGANISLP